MDGPTNVHTELTESRPPLEITKAAGRQGGKVGGSQGPSRWQRMYPPAAPERCAILLAGTEITRSEAGVVGCLFPKFASLYNLFGAPLAFLCFLAPPTPFSASAHRPLPLKEHQSRTKDEGKGTPIHSFTTLFHHTL